MAGTCRQIIICLTGNNLKKTNLLKSELGLILACALDHRISYRIPNIPDRIK